MSSYTITGILKVKNDTIQVSEKFSKREFVLTDNSAGMYPEHVSFQLTQDKCALLDQFNVNDQLTVAFNLKGREWTSPAGEVKYFNSLDAWRIEKAGATQNGGGIPASGPSPMNIDAIPTTPVSVQSTETADDDDLPF